MAGVAVTRGGGPQTHKSGVRPHALHFTFPFMSEFSVSRYDMGIQTFDTANGYSNGLSEIILGKAIKEFGFPREEIVVMTKVSALIHNQFLFAFRVVLCHISGPRSGWQNSWREILVWGEPG